MVDDLGPLLEAIEGLRSDMREDLGAIRHDLADTEERLVSQVTAYTSAHAQEHATVAAKSGEDHERFNAFIRNAELAQARRDGALGVIRFLFELTSRHSGALIKVVAAITAALLVVNGNVSVAIQ